jgi:A/G-specific adenine glycosylase
VSLPSVYLFCRFMMPKQFASKIIDWYKANHRPLPWRGITDPYKIWLSEIILQQTRVAQGLPYYEKFVNTFPTVQGLAKASEQQVLRLWQGLGYYSRARNLHACAKKVVNECGGKFPDNYIELQKLPGIGPYTAAAIASFAFRESVAVVDGNVFRVLARVFGIDEDIASPKGKQLFSQKASELIDAQQPDIFNQAMMEFGAMHCLPQNPLCNDCIFSKACVAHRDGLQKLLPVKEKKTKIRKRYFYYFVIRHQHKILMKKREGKDIWQGLYDFYLVESKRSKTIDSILVEEQSLKKLKPISASKPIKHILSHQQLLVRFLEIEIDSNEKFYSMAETLGLQAYNEKQIVHLPKPVLISKYFSD